MATATANRDGVNVFYEDVGSGDPPFVFVHGIGNHDHYRAQIEHFSAAHRVVAPDLPGFGRSDAPTDREYTAAAFAADVAWLCDELEVRGAVLVGHSMAGAVALGVAATRPDLAVAVILLDPLPIVPIEAFGAQTNALAEALWSPNFREIFREFVEAMMFVPGDDPHRRAQIVDEMCVTPQHVLASVMSTCHDGAEAAARKVSVPVLVVSMGNLPVDVPATAAVLPQLQFGRTVGSAHFAHAMAPEQVNAMIERFLTTSLVAARQS